MKLRTRIRYIYFIGMVLTIAIVMAFSMTTFYNLNRTQQAETILTVDRAMGEEVELKVGVLMKTLASNLFDPLYQYDFNQIEILLSSVAKNEEVRNLFIFDNDGKLFLNLNLSPEDESLILDKISLLDLATTSSMSFADNIMFVEKISNKTTQLGFVVAIVSLDARMAFRELVNKQFAEAQVEFKRRLYGFYTVIGFLIALGVIVFTYYLKKYLIEPLLKLSEQAHRVGLEEYDEPIILDADEELTDLAESLDAMRIMLKLSAKKQRRLAYFDKVTDLPNRHLFHNDVEIMIEQKEDFCILFCDLDDFKIVNDSMGHAVGDELLSAFGNRAMGRLSIHGVQDFTLYRMGGDEFVLAIKGVSQGERAIEIGKMLVNATTEPFRIQSHLCEIGVSIGGALYPKDADNLDDLLINADVAMYKAKQTGKNQMHLFEKFDMTDKQDLA